MHRAGPAGHRRPKSRSHKLRDALAVMNQPGAFSHRRRHPHLIHFLKSRHPLFRQLGAAGHKDNRAFRGINGRQPRYGVGKAGAAGEHRHRRLAGNAGIAVGHVHRRPFVAGVNKLNPLVRRRIHQGQDGIANDSEHPPHPLLFQAANEKMAPVHQLRHKNSSLSCLAVLRRKVAA